MAAWIHSDDAPGVGGSGFRGAVSMPTFRDRIARILRDRIPASTQRAG
jgi:hypothetical protein